WTIPVVATSAVSGEGLDELVAALDGHRRVALDTEAGKQRRLAIADFRLRKTAENLLLERFEKVAAAAGAPLAARLARREADPYSLASELLDSPQHKEHAHEPDARSKIA
ncbi:MAG: methylmalonyl Co-A mutase-associated GTPase MeaB, partial [Rhodoplanes sp.]